MYLGSVVVDLPAYRDKWISLTGSGRGSVVSVRSGTFQQTFERYECEKCGYVAQVLGKAEEKFYCRDCQTLIGID